MNRLVKLLQQSEFGSNIIGVSRHSFNNQQGNYLFYLFKYSMKIILKLSFILGLEYLKALCHPHYLPSIYAFQEKYDHYLQP